MVKRRILTGDRPTGKLHLGHYVGSLKNRIELQDMCESFFIIADLHVLTTRPGKKHIDEIRHNIREIVLDYLALGINAEKNTFFIQSAIHGTYELNLLFEMLISVTEGAISEREGGRRGGQEEIGPCHQPVPRSDPGPTRPLRDTVQADRGDSDQG